ncbi:unnamed protein product [Protopolystoma xenopodis]|uniref:Uncharacterized protein n=1 Tax=Protopolystoma xenopodis TaxID=117903 RepID=A0A3S5BPB9_9PLAT|nr:unnamed protein product [Protopolystoma xenopodis]
MKDQQGYINNAGRFRVEIGGTHSANLSTVTTADVAVTVVSSNIVITSASNTFMNSDALNLYPSESFVRAQSSTILSTSQVSGQNSSQVQTSTAHRSDPLPSSMLTTCWPMSTIAVSGSQQISAHPDESITESAFSIEAGKSKKNLHTLGSTDRGLLNSDIYELEDYKPSLSSNQSSDQGCAVSWVGKTLGGSGTELEDSKPFASGLGYHSKSIVTTNMQTINCVSGNTMTNNNMIGRTMSPSVDAGILSTSSLIHLENPERETRWYFKYFLGKSE